MLGAESIQQFITNAVQGLVGSLGLASPKVEFVERPDGQGVIALVREGYKTATLEGKRANSRIHQFEEIQSLSDWLKRHAKADSVEVLVGTERVLAALTPRDVYGDAVSCPLHSHPRFKRWHALFQKYHEQRPLHRFVLGALDDFGGIPIGGGDSLNEGEQIAAQLAKFQAIKTSDVNIEIDELGVIRFASISEKTDLKGRLQPRFKIQVPIFLGVQKLVEGAAAGEATYELEVHLHLQVRDGAGPLFELACPNLDVVLREARLDAVAWLRHLLGAEFLVGLGDLKLNSVPVVAK